jgi:hypothetical protein
MGLLQLLGIGKQPGMSAPALEGPDATRVQSQGIGTDKWNGLRQASPASVMPPRPQQRVAPQQASATVGDPYAPPERKGLFGINMADPQQMMALKMISNGLSPSIGKPRPMFEGVSEAGATADALYGSRRERTKEGKLLQEKQAQDTATRAWVAQNAPEMLSALDSGLITAQDIFRNKNNPTKTEYQEREAAADMYNLAPGSPERQAFILTGKLGGDGNALVDMARVFMDNDTIANENAKSVTARASLQVQNADEAYGKQQRLAALGDLLSQTETGAGASLKIAAAKIGIFTDGTSELEAAKALISQMIPAQRPPGSGTMSDADAEMFRDSLPGIMRSPRGNAIIIATLSAISNNDIALGQAAMDWQDGKIELSEYRARQRELQASSSAAVLRAAREAGRYTEDPNQPPPGQGYPPPTVDPRGTPPPQTTPGGNLIRERK